MGRLAIFALRAVLAVALAGSLGVQLVLVPLLWADLADVAASTRTVFVVIVVLGVGTLQVCAVCVWRLLTLVRRGRVFSPRAFRFVDVIIGAIAAAALLTFLIAVMLAPGDVAPGVVALICGAALVIGGVALIVTVLRMLLAQAVARDAEARGLEAQLSEVI